MRLDFTRLTEKPLIQESYKALFYHENVQKESQIHRELLQINKEAHFHTNIQKKTLLENNHEMKEKYKSTLQTELNKLKKAFEKMGIHLESKIQKKKKLNAQMD